MNIRVFFYDGVDYSTGEMLSASVAFSENYIEFVGYELLPTDECSIIMRGTAFKDKNGKEIYEGDILGDWVEVDGEMEQSKLQVYFYEKLGQWMLDFSLNQDKSCGFALFDELQKFDYEIIGNIYENPTN